MKIVIDVPTDQPGLDELGKLGQIEIAHFDWPEAEAPSRVLEPARIRDANALFCSSPPVNLEEMKALRWIQISSVGYAQLIGRGLVERRIRATNCRGCLDVPIAEWNLSMMVNLARNLRQMIRNQEGAVWDRSAVFQAEIRGRTVGFWGYGGIGRETARLARQMGMPIHVLVRNGVHPRRDLYAVPGTGDPDGVLPDRVFSSGEELDFLRGLDFLIVAMPLTPATKGLIGERELQALPRTAYLLNPARGPIVQEAALLRALRENWIAGAALDTHYQYPLPPDHPLWRFSNVILTPHISGAADNHRFQERLWDLFVKNVERFSRDRPLLNELTPEQLAGG